MPQIPDTFARRPTPRFGGVDRASPVVESGKVAQGRAIQSFAGDMGSYFAREEAKQEKLELDAKTIEYKRRVSEIEREYRQKRGAQVADDPEFFKTYQERHEQIREEVMGEVSNPNVRTALGNRMDLGEINLSEGLTNHLMREREVFEGQVFEGTIQLAQDGMGSDYLNDSMLAQHRDDIIVAVDDFAKKRGMAPEAKEAMKKKALTQGHLAVIQNGVDSGNVAYAEEYYRDYKTEILSDKHDDVDRLLKSAGLRVRSQDAVEGYISAGLTEAEAREQARKQYDGEIEDAVIQRIGARYGENNKLLQQNQSMASEVAWRIMADTEDYDQIPTSVLENMDGKEMLALKDYAHKLKTGGKIVTDWGEYYQLKQMLADPSTRQDFMDTNLMTYRNRLADSEFEELVKLQTSPVELSTASSKAQIMKQGAANVGISTQQIRKGFGDDIEAYYRRVDNEVTAFELANQRKATTKDIREITDRLGIEVLRERSLKPWNDLPFGINTTDFAIKMEIEGVPSNLIDELAADLRADGKPVTEANIIDLYKELNQ